MKTKFLLFPLFVMSFACLFTACSDDDNERTENITVVIKDDGTTSNGSIFSAIDDKNFYLDYVKYKVVEGHLEVAGYDSEGFKGVAKIVSSITYKGSYYEVLEIGSEAFRNSSILTSVYFSNSIRRINFRAFDNCKNLTSISLPNSMTIVGYGAFDNCTNLKSVTISNSVTTIDVAAFSNTGINSITIPASVTSIDFTSFSGCSSLASIIVEKGNQIYDSRNNCNAIINSSSNCLIISCSNTTIPQSVTSIGYAAFAGISNINSIDIPNSVTSIGDYAFSRCPELASITIPNSVTSIGNYAFSRCPELASITIPNSVTSIGNYAFSDCTSLSDVICYIENPQKVSVGDGDCFYKSNYQKATLHVPAASIELYKTLAPWKYFGSIVAL